MQTHLSLGRETKPDRPNRPSVPQLDVSEIPNGGRQTKGKLGGLFPNMDCFHVLVRIDVWLTP